MQAELKDTWARLSGQAADDEKRATAAAADERRARMLAKVEADRQRARERAAAMPEKLEAPVCPDVEDARRLLRSTEHVANGGFNDFREAYSPWQVKVQAHASAIRRLRSGRECLAQALGIVSKARERLTTAMRSHAKQPNRPMLQRALDEKTRAYQNAQDDLREWITETTLRLRGVDDVLLELETIPAAERL